MLVGLDTGVEVELVLVVSDWRTGAMIEPSILNLSRISGCPPFVPAFVRVRRWMPSVNGPESNHLS